MEESIKKASFLLTDFKYSIENKRPSMLEGLSVSRKYIF